MQHNSKAPAVKTIVLLLLILGLLSSCDCMQRLQGYVIDAETGEPLSEVFYSRDSLLTAQEKQYKISDTSHRYHRRTDSTGWFADWRLVNGFNCRPHLVLWLDRDGYRPVRVLWQRGKSNLDTLVVRLHKSSAM